MYDFLLKAMQETEASFVSRVGGRDCFRLRESRPVSQSESQLESQAEVPLVVKGLQKQTCYLDGISHREGSERWASTIYVWRSNAKGKTPLCHR